MEPAAHRPILAVPDAVHVVTRAQASKAGKASAAAMTPEERRARSRWAASCRWVQKRPQLPLGQEWTWRESARLQARLMLSDPPRAGQLDALIASGMRRAALLFDQLDKKQRALLTRAVLEIDTTIEIYRRYALSGRRIPR